MFYSQSKLSHVTLFLPFLLLFMAPPPQESRGDAARAARGAQLGKGDKYSSFLSFFVGNVPEQQLKPVQTCVIQARLEVHRFGITGFKKEQQRVFEQDRAVMLGARVSTAGAHLEHTWHSAA